MFLCVYILYIYVNIHNIYIYNMCVYIYIIYSVWIWYIALEHAYQSPGEGYALETPSKRRYYQSPRWSWSSERLIGLRWWKKGMGSRFFWCTRKFKPLENQRLTKPPPKKVVGKFPSFFRLWTPKNGCYWSPKNGCSFSNWPFFQVQVPAVGFWGV